MRFDQLVCPLIRRLCLFTDLQERFLISKTAFYGYLQIRHLASITDLVWPHREKDDLTDISDPHLDFI